MPRPSLVTVLRVYVLLTLVAAAVVAPTLMTLVPLAIFAGYLVVWRWPISRAQLLLTDSLVFYALALLFEASLGAWCLLLALPLLYLVGNDLERLAVRRRVITTVSRRRPTNIAMTLLLMALGAVLISQILASLALLLSGGLALVSLAVLYFLIWLRLPLTPLRVATREQRILVSAHQVFRVAVAAANPLGGYVHLRPTQPWVKLRGGPYLLRSREINLKLSVTPETSGPHAVRLLGTAYDRWGLTQNSFETVPLRLNVIPRARYAAWLARRFLAETAGSELSYMAGIPESTARFVSVRGVEYLYSREYQPGDSLAHIDWKHSVKFDDLITKNFVELRGRQALVLVNLSTAGEVEADQVAYKLLMTAISLARETVPGVLAVYDHHGVRLVSRITSPRRLMVQALKLVRELTPYRAPMRYLAPPEVGRLRAGLSRLRKTDDAAAGVLADLMRWEIENLKQHASASPVATALRRAGGGHIENFAVMVISALNHDADAIAYHRYRLEEKGIDVVRV